MMPPEMWSGSAARAQPSSDAASKGERRDLCRHRRPSRRLRPMRGQLRAARRVDAEGHGHGIVDIDRMAGGRGIRAGQADQEVVVADRDPVALGQHDAAGAADRRRSAVDEGAVGRQVEQHVSAVDIVDQAMVLRHEPRAVLQHPIVVLAAPQGQAAAIEGPGGVAPGWAGTAGGEVEDQLHGRGTREKVRGSTVLTAL